VSIHGVERFLGDLALERGWMFDPPAASSGKRVLVVGAGPSGLSAAYHLARRGHGVEIRDAGPEPGGMMRYGIPAYRAERLLGLAEEAIRQRWQTYEEMATRGPERFPADARKDP
jgi:NADPH-dependent glutamate synthase beta subunit-like oxidoreductase